MSSENKTVAEIVKRVQRECNSYQLPKSAGEILKLVHEFEEAHKREVAELVRCLKAAVDDYFKNQCPRCMGCRSTLRCEYRGWKAVLEKYTESEVR